MNNKINRHVSVQMVLEILFSYQENDWNILTQQKFQQYNLLFYKKQ